MMRNILTFIVITLFLASCGNKGSEKTSLVAEGAGETAKVEFASLIEHPQDFVGQSISVEGKVVHVCMQSGKKMFIVGENPDIRLFITAGEDMPKFPTELLGSQIVVEGTIERVAAAETSETASGQGMHAEGEKGTAVSADSCENEMAMARQPVLSDLMMVYNRHTIK